MAISNTKLKDVAYSTDFRYERVSLKNKVSFTMSTTLLTLTIPHNLGYEPFFRVFVRFPSSADYYYQTTGPASSLLVSPYQVENIYVDSTNLYVTVSCSPATGATGTLYYRIYAERR